MQYSRNKASLKLKQSISKILPEKPWSSQLLVYLLTLIMCIAGNSQHLVAQAVNDIILGTADLEKVKVYSFELNEDIMPPVWRIVKSAMNEAKAVDADVILMKMDTYGGMVNIADSISQRMLHAKAKVLVYITNNAASAGALIAISCDSIYMAPSSQIGAATVVNGTDGEAMPDKYQAYMRGKMRSLAESSGRDPQIAEAMVDQDIEIPGIIEKGKTLVFTASEAVENGYCEGIAETWEEALELAGITSYTLIEYKPSGVDKVVKFLVNPVVSGLLLMVIFFGIYSELQSPGVGFPILAALIGATLYFAPHYLDGLAANWEIALFIVGIILMAAELFIIPGFGIAGVAGLVAMISALTLAMVGNDMFDFSFTPTAQIGLSLFITLTALVGSTILVVLFFRNVSTENSTFSRLVLNEKQDAERGFTTDSYNNRNQLNDALGSAISDLRPSGKVEINGEWYDAMTEGGYISKGDPIKVIQAKGNYLLVRNQA
jgi:membrane-bound serine protease (ClpP class)